MIAWDTVKCCFCRSRGGSKTHDFTNWLIFRVLRTGEQWAWLAGKGGQLSQALLYVQKNPFVRSVKCITNNTKYDVTLYSGDVIRFGIVSTSNLGMRYDGIIFDEFQDIEKSSKMEEAYWQMEDMTSHSVVHKIIYTGTLWINRLFNDYTHVYPTSIRAWDTIPWLVKAGKIQKDIDDGIVPVWKIDLQNRCIESAPGGLVFPKVEYVQNITQLAESYHNLSSSKFGTDFGGIDRTVGIAIVDETCFVLDEREVQLDVAPTALDFLRGYDAEVEDGFYNNEKAKFMVTRVGCSKVEVSKMWISQRLSMGRGFKKIVCVGCKQVYEDVKGATYDPIDDRYLKDTKHPCHWLDAFLHAIGAQSKRFIAPPTDRRLEIMKAEKGRR